MANCCSSGILIVDVTGYKVVKHKYMFSTLNEAALQYFSYIGCYITAPNVFILSSKPQITFKSKPNNEPTRFSSSNFTRSSAICTVRGKSKLYFLRFSARNGKISRERKAFFKKKLAHSKSQKANLASESPQFSPNKPKISN